VASAMPQAHVLLELFSASTMKSQVLLNRNFAMDVVTA
jgi:hypothetical protein